MWWLFLLPAHHLSGAIPIDSKPGCWCLKPGCKAEPTDSFSPIVLWFLLKDDFNMHLTKPVLLPVTCCMLQYRVLPESCVVCWATSEGADSIRPAAVRWLTWPARGIEGVSSVRCRILLCFESAPEAVWGSSNPPVFWNLCCPRPCHSCQGTLEIWSLASYK